MLCQCHLINFSNCTPVHQGNEQPIHTILGNRPFQTILWEDDVHPISVLQQLGRPWRWMVERDSLLAIPIEAILPSEWIGNPVWSGQRLDQSDLEINIRPSNCRSVALHQECQATKTAVGMLFSLTLHNYRKSFNMLRDDNGVEMTCKSVSKSACTIYF